MKTITKITLILLLLISQISVAQNSTDSLLREKETKINEFIKTKEFKRKVKFLKTATAKYDKEKADTIFEEIISTYEKIIGGSIYWEGLKIEDKLYSIKKCRKKHDFINTYYSLDLLPELDTNYINLKEQPFDKNYKEFQQLSIEAKKRKLLLVTEQLKDKNEVFQQIYTEIKNNNPNIDNEFLDGVYYDIFNFGQRISNAKNPKYHKTFLLYLSLVYYYSNKCI